MAIILSKGVLYHFISEASRGPERFNQERVWTTPKLKANEWDYTAWCHQDLPPAAASLTKSRSMASLIGAFTPKWDLFRGSITVRRQKDVLVSLLRTSQCPRCHLLRRIWFIPPSRCITVTAQISWRENFSLMFGFIINFPNSQWSFVWLIKPQGLMLSGSFLHSICHNS